MFGKSTRIAPFAPSTRQDRARASACDQNAIKRYTTFVKLPHALHALQDSTRRATGEIVMLCRHDSDVSAFACTICHVRDDRRFVGLSLATILLGYEALVAWRLASDSACARHLNAPGAVRLNTPGKRLAPCARTAPWLCAPTEWVRPGSYPSAQSPDYLGLVSQSPDYLGLVSAQASLQVGHGERASGELLDG